MKLQRAEQVSYASFETAWRPDLYLSQYYSSVENDERVTLRFLVDAARFIGRVPFLLDFGCGPTVHHLFPFAATATEIHLADYLPANLAAIRSWVAREDEAHDWSDFAAYALGCQQGRSATGAEIDALQSLTRQRITACIPADARCESPIRDDRALRSYPAVICCFCADSITHDQAEWRRCTRNIASLVAPGGWLVLAALRATDSYRVGEVRFPSARVSEHDVAEVLLEAGFPVSSSTVSVEFLADERGFGFDSVILALGRRSWS